MTDVIKFIQANLAISDTVSIDCYMLPSGEKRIGITGAALSVARPKNYLSRLVTKTGSKSLEALQNTGFEGYLLEGNVIKSDGRGSPIAKTLSVRDYTKYVTFEAVKNQRKEAIVILAALAETGLEQTLDLLFSGKSVQFILDKIVHYTKWTNDDLQQALMSNWEDVAEIEEQLAFVGVL